MSYLHCTDLRQINTALQLVLMGVTTVSPIVPMDIGLALQGLQCVLLLDFTADYSHHHSMSLQMDCCHNNDLEWSVVCSGERWISGRLG